MTTTEKILTRPHIQELKTSPTWSYDGAFILDLSTGIWDKFLGTIFQLDWQKRQPMVEAILNRHGDYHPMQLATRYIAALGHEDFDDVETRERTGSLPEDIRTRVLPYLSLFEIDTEKVADAYLELAKGLHAYLHELGLYIDGYFPYELVFTPNRGDLGTGMFKFSVEPVRVYRQGSGDNDDLGWTITYMRRLDFNTEK